MLPQSAPSVAMRAGPRVTSQPVDAEPVELRRPGRTVGEVPHRVIGQAGDQRRRQAALTQVVSATSLMT